MTTTLAPLQHPGTDAAGRQRLVVDSVRDEAPGIRSYRLHAAPGSRLLPFTAGAHIDVHLECGLVRSYSLCNDPRETDRYEIAVACAPQGGGGSAFIHAQWQPGSTVQAGAPRNTFPLAPGAHRAVLLAGGIGITPMLSMIAALRACGADWRLFYAARRREQFAFRAQLEAFGERVRLHADDEAGCVFDMAAALREAPPDAHLYCCGPVPMLDAFQSLCAGRDPERVHLEHFAGAQPCAGAPFRVCLAKSGRSFEVGPSQSILEVLLAAGVEVPYSCSQGTCGECATGVVDGIPDHRDMVLTRRKRAENTVMMICCSRAQSSSITLDL